MSVCWRDYIYEEFGKHRSSSSVKRRRDLAVRISDQPTALDKNGIFILMREEYKNKTERTLSRDLNELVKMRLIVREKDKYTANKNLILQFLPFIAALSTSVGT
jgi:CYTH domain-containing protein